MGCACAGIGPQLASSPTKPLGLSLRERWCFESQWLFFLPLLLRRKRSNNPPNSAAISTQRNCALDGCPLRRLLRDCDDGNLHRIDRSTMYVGSPRRVARGAATNHWTGNHEQSQSCNPTQSFRSQRQERDALLLQWTPCNCFGRGHSRPCLFQMDRSRQTAGRRHKFLVPGKTGAAAREITD
jgi:hypothetical protein